MHTKHLSLNTNLFTYSYSSGIRPPSSISLARIQAATVWPEWSANERERERQRDRDRDRKRRTHTYRERERQTQRESHAHTHTEKRRYMLHTRTRGASFRPHRSASQHAAPRAPWPSMAVAVWPEWSANERERQRESHTHTHREGERGDSICYILVFEGHHSVLSDLLLNAHLHELLGKYPGGDGLARVERQRESGAGEPSPVVVGCVCGVCVCVCLCVCVCVCVCGKA